MKRYITTPAVIENDFEKNRKRTRMTFNGPAQNNLADSQPVIETTTRVIPYLTTNWSVMIEPESCVFMAIPNKQRNENRNKPAYDDKYLLNLHQVNVVLHQLSLTYTMFPGAGMGNKKRLAELEDLMCFWTYRGVNQTRKAEGSMQSSQRFDMTRDSNFSVHRDMVAWFRGDTFCLNYWGNVPGGGTHLYFVLKKVRIDTNTDYKLSDTLIATEENFVRNDRNGQPENDQDAPKTRQMVFQWVPMFPGCVTFDNPKGSTTPQRNLSIQELSYVDYDDPIDPNTPTNSSDASKFKVKLGHPVLVGICVHNPSYNAQANVSLGSLTKAIRDAPHVHSRQKIAMYAYSNTY